MQVKAKVMAPPKEQSKKNRCQRLPAGEKMEIKNKAEIKEGNENRETIAMHLSREGCTVEGVSAAE